MNANEQALLSYHARRRASRVLVCGAVNAIPPTTARPQVKFRLDQSGGWRTYRGEVWRRFANACGPCLHRAGGAFVALGPAR